MYKSSALLIDFEAHHGLGNGNLVSHRCWQCQPVLWPLVPFSMVSKM